MAVCAGRAQRVAEHADHDRADREVLVAARRARRASCSPRTISTSRPAASAGCTTTSGASISATTCSGQPRIDRPVPSSQRPAPHESPGERQAQVLLVGSLAWRPSPAGRSLGCRASTRRPRRGFPAPVRPCPPTIIALAEHRSPARWPGLAGAATRCRRLAGRLAARCAGRSAWRTARPTGSGYALTFDDGPHAAGHAGGARDAAPRARAGDLLPGRRAGPPQPLAATRDPRRGPRDRAALRPPPQPAAPRPAPGARGHRPRRGLDRGEPPAGRRACTARPTACSTRPRCGSPTRAAGGRCCGAIGAATGRRSATGESIAAKVTEGAGDGAVLLLHDADDYSAPGSWRRTLAALPTVIETMRERGVEPVLAVALPARSRTPSSGGRAKIVGLSTAVSSSIRRSTLPPRSRRSLPRGAAGAAGEPRCPGGGRRPVPAVCAARAGGSRLLTIAWLLLGLRRGHEPRAAAAGRALAHARGDPLHSSARWGSPPSTRSTAGLRATIRSALASPTTTTTPTSWSRSACSAVPVVAARRHLPAAAQLAGADQRARLPRLLALPGRAAAHAGRLHRRRRLHAMRSAPGTPARWPLRRTSSRRCPRCTSPGPCGARSRSGG